MTWLLFMDESGHDHKNAPLEVRGGFAIHASKLWPFILDWQNAVEKNFGSKFIELGGEIKSHKLLETKRFEWAQRGEWLAEKERHAAVRQFLTQQKQKHPTRKRHFTAYGQASLGMADGVFHLLQTHGAKLFASAIPKGVKPPKGFRFEHYLRKDHVFLQERFFYFLEKEREHGLFVMDQTEKENDKRFLKKLMGYYTKTQTGLSRTQWIVPSPLFVDSELAPCIQAADLCLYAINWGFRPPQWAFTGARREDVASRYGAKISNLQFRGDGYRDGETFSTFGIVYVPDPFTARSATK